MPYTTDEIGAVLNRDYSACHSIATETLRIVAGVGSRRRKTRVERMSDPLGQSAMKRENTAEERQPSRPTI